MISASIVDGCISFASISSWFSSCIIMYDYWFLSCKSQHEICAVYKGHKRIETQYMHHHAYSIYEEHVAYSKWRKQWGTLTPKQHLNQWLSLRIAVFGSHLKRTTSNDVFVYTERSPSMMVYCWACSLLTHWRGIAICWGMACNAYQNEQLIITWHICIFVCAGKSIVSDQKRKASLILKHMVNMAGSITHHETFGLRHISSIGYIFVPS